MKNKESRRPQDSSIEIRLLDVAHFVAMIGAIVAAVVVLVFLVIALRLVKKSDVGVWLYYCGCYLT